MSPTTSRGVREIGRDARKIAGLVFSRLGNLDRRVVCGIDGHHATPAAEEADLPRGTLRQVDDCGTATHPIVDDNDDRLPRLGHRHPHARAERDAAAGSGHALLVENRAGTGAKSVMPSAIPRRHADRLSESHAREEGGHR
jgi:hypothetical protein